jgi:hypothetical protein
MTDRASSSSAPEDRPPQVLNSGAVAARDVNIRGTYAAGWDVNVTVQQEAFAPTSDELLRGPILALGLQDVLDEAEAAVTADPGRAGHCMRRVKVVTTSSTRHIQRPVLRAASGRSSGLGKDVTRAEHRFLPDLCNDLYRDLRV